MELSEITRELYEASGRLNLYTHFAMKKNKLDVLRLKTEIEGIKKLISKLEDKVKNF